MGAKHIYLSTSAAYIWASAAYTRASTAYIGASAAYLSESENKAKLSLAELGNKPNAWAMSIPKTAMFLLA